jgi:hypothetical protein
MLLAKEYSRNSALFPIISTQSPSNLQAISKQSPSNLQAISKQSPGNWVLCHGPHDTGHENRTQEQKTEKVQKTHFQKIYNSYIYNCPTLYLPEQAGTNKLN